MKIIRKIPALLLLLIPFLSLSQENNVLGILHSNNIEKVKMQFMKHPLLSEQLKADSSNVGISVYTKNCKEGLIIADSIKFTFSPINSSSKVKSSITIVPDTLTTFSSHIFAFMLYEHAEIFEKPKISNKPIFTTSETDEFDSLLFLDQRIDKKGQIWYYVQFNSKRYVNSSTESELEKTQIKGWVLRGRTRINYWGAGCF